MKEPSENIIQVCKCCTAKMKSETQKDIKNKIIKGMLKAKKIWIKLPFTDGDTVEHMWVRLTNFNPETLKVSGTLDNVPVDVKNIKHSDKVTVDMSEIEDILTD